MATLLIIEDEVVLAKNIARHFERQGHTVEVAHTGPAGLESARELLPDVVIVDFQLPGLDGLEVIRSLRVIDAEMRAIMVTGHASVPMAVDAMKAGSMDLLTKPVSLANLTAVVNRALNERGTRRALDYYQRRAADHSSLEALVGSSQPMRALRDLVRTIAASEPTDHSTVPPVLVLGETGAGKELVARACHFSGPRAGAPFVEINCAALPAHLIEDELFGHEKGAFTDAQARKVGLIESADGGTLFLDEIGELDLSLQAKLLRVLENLRVRRLGALQDRQVNVRIVAATNRNLEEQVQAGRFRADLLYRLRVFQISIPPLRARGADVLELTDSFLRQFAARYAKSPPALSVTAREALLSHDWPGNVRELRNVMERAVLLARSDTLEAEDLAIAPRPPALHGMPAHANALGVGNAPAGAASLAPSYAPPGEGATLEEIERQHLLRALAQTEWNVTQAARVLGVSRDTLRYRIEKHGLQR